MRIGYREIPKESFSTARVEYLTVTMNTHGLNVYIEKHLKLELRSVNTCCLLEPQVNRLSEVRLF